MKKLSSETLFLNELGKIIEKFQLNWTYKTQVMNLLVKCIRFWADCVGVNITWVKWLILKKSSK